MLTRTTSCRDGWHWAEQSRLVKYYHDRRYDEVIRYARRNPRKAKNSCFEDRVRRFSGNGRRRRSLLLSTAALSVSCRFLSCLEERSKKDVPIDGGSFFCVLLLRSSLARSLTHSRSRSRSLFSLLRPCSWARHTWLAAEHFVGVWRGLAPISSITPPNQGFHRRTGTSITRYSYSDTYRQCLRTACSKKPERKGIKISLFHPSHSSTEPKIESNPQTAKSSKWPST